MSTFTTDNKKIPGVLFLFLSAQPHSDLSLLIISIFTLIIGFGWSKPVFQLGEKTLAVPMSLHRACRAKVVDMFRARGFTNGVILIKGGEEQNQYDTDIELVFRQDSWFNYLFGVMEPGISCVFVFCLSHAPLFACDCYPCA